MKIDVNLSALFKNVKKMGADEVDFELDIWTDSDIEFDDQLATTGVEIKLDDLETEQGLLSVRGRQVILFIPDHSSKFYDALNNPSDGNKFHIVDCSTLDTMKRRKRFERYQVTNNMTGLFSIFGIDGYGGVSEGEARLHVCKNCINQLNYLGAANVSAKERHRIVELFDVEKFFTTFSSVFKKIPRKFAKNVSKGYADNWKSISSNLRKEMNYTCQECFVNLSNNKNLLHVHHLNGVKSDNNPSNLKVLCADCHRKEPFHERMFVKRKDVLTINKLRKTQNVIDESSWKEIFKYADPAVHGVLDHCKRKNFSPPEVGYEITNGLGEVLAEIELAWPTTKLGVHISDTELIEGWEILSLNDALKRFREQNRRY